MVMGNKGPMLDFNEVFAAQNSRVIYPPDRKRAFWWLKSVMVERQYVAGKYLSVGSGLLASGSDN